MILCRAPDILTYAALRRPEPFPLACGNLPAKSKILCLSNTYGLTSRDGLVSFPQWRREHAREIWPMCRTCSVRAATSRQTSACAVRKHFYADPLWDRSNEVRKRQRNSL